MSWLARVTALVASALCVAPSLAADAPLAPLPSSALFALSESPDPALVWAQYERSLLSRERVTPWLLFFTGDCEQEDDDEGADAAAQVACVDHEKLLHSAMETVAKSLETVKYPVVRVDTREWSQMKHYHLLSSTPSLLWMPGRSSGRFQRYPHVETNFLDLTVNGSLFVSKFGDTEVSSTDVAEEVATFVRQCQERSGYLTRNARGRMTVTVPPSGNEHDAFAWLELVPGLVLLAFIAMVVNENREFVLSVVRTRLFWFVLCLGVIYVAVSGVFYSIIHHSAWYYYGRQHGFVFVYPSSRRQFVLEGLVNGTWSFWLSLAVMSLADVTPTLRSRLARQELLRWSLLLVVVSYMAVYLTFLMKYRWLA